MYHFFVNPLQVDLDGNIIKIEGSDVNHIKNVLRMHIGEEICVSDGNDNDYYCKIAGYKSEGVLAEIVGRSESSARLCAEIYLFQGLPKSDKMEFIIQKAVELGVSGIIPVETKRCVVKLDDKKKEVKLKRFMAVSESAAKQSGRNEIPKVFDVMSFSEAINYAKDFDIKLIPYESANTKMQDTREAVRKIKPGMKVGIFIGPEGGFEESEIKLACENSIKPITLGKRILRTETAGIMLLSAIVYELEE